MRQSGGNNTFSGYDITNYYADIRLNGNKSLDIASSFSPSFGYFGEVVIEYTKVNDYGLSGNDSYKEYTHYVLSSDPADNVVTKVINDNLVTYTGGYTYDDVTGQCTN
ncbi:hypothetical protein C2869_19745 [Saccharobesus litoralis]|uniref:Uncharacterized protein n=1 Tax=Saccharobesus litoralis TaxID=2172099 RepID=A0A2S0VWA0_9ALTE|nr:hypothetical protein [Saccharobesus litoralis]AWB68497.1 hypothetical protein C2869_19745 [Saccharobesus litoralis]